MEGTYSLNKLKKSIEHSNCEIAFFLSFPIHLVSCSTVLFCQNPKKISDQINIEKRTRKFARQARRNKQKIN